MNGRFIAYYRVSTERTQGINGLGMGAQRKAIENYLNGGNWQLLAEFAEVESGKRKDRPELLKAIAMCAKEKATLLIARLDRLARNAAFLLGLMESGIKFICVDAPGMDNFTCGILAMVAQQEADNTSKRTILGLQEAKRRGVKLGNPNPAEAIKLAAKAKREQADAYAERLKPVVEQIKTKAHITSLRGIAEVLNARGFKTPNGKNFAAQSVKNLLERLG